ncbi:MAG: metal-dependent phosphohydrolase [Clostridiales bacterium]|nr:metal-dependent phosphohydrolase [Clostridiales bacterium]
MADGYSISKEQREANKKRITELLLSTKRPGMERLVEWITTKTDFFSAPASTKYHLCCEGGLAQHSLHVYQRLSEKVAQGLIKIEPDTVIITSLLHDLCKVNFYVKEIKNVKEGTKINQYGKEVANWVEKEVWGIKDSFPVGHGEKSCCYIQNFIRLKSEEYAMIRLHMGPDKNTYPDPFSETAKIFPSVVAIFTSDIESAYILEERQ